MEVRSFKMRTGEEVTCEIIERLDDGSVVVKNPIMIIQAAPDQPQMVGYFQTSGGQVEDNADERKNRQFTFTKEMYWMEGKPMSFILAAYDKEFGAGLVVPPQNIVASV